MSCFNCSGECCFDETGCLWNNGHNTCMADKWNSYHNAMPTVDKPTLDKFRRRLQKRHGNFAEIIITRGRHSILGQHYYVTVVRLLTNQNPLEGEMIIRDGVFWYREDGR